jgi:hypothetical protein
VLLSVWALIYAPLALSLITLIWIWYLVGRILFALYAHTCGLQKIKWASEQDWCALYADFSAKNTGALKWEDIHHIVLLPNDHEPITILRASLACLAQSPEAHHMTVVLAMESREIEALPKATQLQAEFESHFAQIIITQHPEGIAGEIRCKSANIGYAIRQVSDNSPNNPAHTVVTVMDSDTLWHPQYFSALTYYFITDEARHHTFWQAPIRYHGKIEALAPALQLVNVYASALELSYLASWWLILPISSYSVSLQLLKAHDYWDKDAIAEEWRIFLKTYFGENGHVKAKPIFLPFTATVVNGATFWGALKNRYYQTVRHALGSKEMSYTMGAIITHPQIPLYKRLRMLGRVSHDITAAGAGWSLMVLGGQGVGLIYGLGVYREHWWVFIGIQVAFVMLTGLAITFWMIDNHVRGEPIIPHTGRERIQTVIAFVLFPFLTFILLTLPVFHAQIWLLLGLPLSFRVSPKTI